VLQANRKKKILTKDAAEGRSPPSETEHHHPLSLRSCYFWEWVDERTMKMTL